MEYRLKEILQDKGYIRGPFGSSLKRNELKSTGIPVYEQQHAIYATREFRYYIDEEKYSQMKRFTVKPNDLIISCSGTIGKVDLISEKDPIGIISQALLILRANTDIVLPEYLFYFFKSDYGYNSIISRSMGSVQVNIAKREVIENIKINIPSLKEQKKVVNILSNIDKKIKLNADMNNNLQKLIDISFKETSIKTDKVKRADEIANITIGKTPPRAKKEYFSKNNYDIKWLSISDIGKCGVYAFDTSEKLTKTAVDKYNVKIVPANTVVLSFKLTVGRVVITNEQMTTNEAIAHFNLYDDKLRGYIYAYLKNYDYKKLGSTSSIAVAVNSKIIKSMPIALPSENDLDKFNKSTNSIFEKIRNNEIENNRLEEIKNILLPKLMDGEVDLKK